MRVLVGYASAHGSTKAIAREVGERLAQQGLDVDLRAVDEVGTVEPYDVVVLGSAIHNGDWLSEAAEALQRHRAALAGRPVWLFSVGSVGETSSFFGPRVARLARSRQPEPKALATLRSAGSLRGHRRFAGVIEPTHWGRLGNLVLRLAGGHFGDHRDWADVRAWADAIGREVTAPVGAAPPDQRRRSSPGDG